MKKEFCLFAKTILFDDDFSTQKWDSVKRYRMRKVHINRHVDAVIRYFWIKVMLGFFSFVSK